MTSIFKKLLVLILSEIVRDVRVVLVWATLYWEVFLIVLPSSATPPLTMT